MIKIYYKNSMGLNKVDQGVLMTSSKPSTLLIGFIIILLLINFFLSFLLASMSLPSTDMAGKIGYIMAQVILFPMLVVGVFQIGYQFRNTKSRYKIFMWSSLLVSLSICGNILSIITPLLKG